jgi:rRNA maturation RNase YbeY
MIRIAVANAHRRRRVPHAPVVREVRRVLRGEGVTDARVTVVFIGTPLCRALNARHLGHPWTTDVLAFPLEEHGTLEGEVYVNLDRAGAQAREYRVPPAEEVRRLVIHGTLHLAGWDDGTPRKRGRMQAREDAYLARAGGKRKEP